MAVATGRGKNVFQEAPRGEGSCSTSGLLQNNAGLHYSRVLPPKNQNKTKIASYGSIGLKTD